MSPVKAPTQAHTYSDFMGSGALSYPWYDVDEYEEGDASNNGWRVTFQECDDYGPVTDDSGNPMMFTFDHASITRAVWLIVLTKDSTHPRVSDECVKQCRNLLFKDHDDVDFDAWSADHVMQIATFGEIRYG